MPIFIKYHWLQRQHSTAAVADLDVAAEVSAAFVDAQHGHGAGNHAATLVILPAAQEAFINLDFNSRSAKLPVDNFVTHDHFAYLAGHAEVVNGSLSGAADGLGGDSDWQACKPADHEA